MTKKLHKLLQLLNEALKVRSRYVQIIKKTYFHKFISITNMSLTFISIESFFGTYYVFVTGYMECTTALPPPNFYFSAQSCITIQLHQRLNPE